MSLFQGIIKHNDKYVCAIFADNLNDLFIQVKYRTREVQTCTVHVTSVHGSTYGLVTNWGDIKISASNEANLFLETKDIWLYENGTIVAKDVDRLFVEYFGEYILGSHVSFESWFRENFKSEYYKEASSDFPAPIFQGKGKTYWFPPYMDRVKWQDELLAKGYVKFEKIS